MPYKAELNFSHHVMNIRLKINVKNNSISKKYGEEKFLHKATAYKPQNIRKQN